MDVFQAITFHPFTDFVDGPYSYTLLENSHGLLFCDIISADHGMEHPE
ncbi:MAG: hypothetical protein HYU64_12135 [Armatimonadetes bacterium]|nr:hypothetical protein [Armatimonadota bacterium]